MRRAPRWSRSWRTTTGAPLGDDAPGSGASDLRLYARSNPQLDEPHHGSPSRRHIIHGLHPCQRMARYVGRRLALHRQLGQGGIVPHLHRGRSDFYFTLGKSDAMDRAIIISRKRRLRARLAAALRLPPVRKQRGQRDRNHDEITQPCRATQHGCRLAARAGIVNGAGSGRHVPSVARSQKSSPNRRRMRV